MVNTITVDIKFKDLFDKVKATYTADELNHLITHGFPDGCSTCEPLAMKFPPQHASGLNLMHPVWIYLVHIMFRDEDLISWGEENLSLPKTHDILFEPNTGLSTKFEREYWESVVIDRDDPDRIRILPCGEHKSKEEALLFTLTWNDHFKSTRGVRHITEFSIQEEQN